MAGAELITDPWFYLAAVPAVLIVGISKGGFGGGLGVMAVPLMSLVIPPLQAAAIMLPILCIMDLVSIWAFRRYRDAPALRVLLPAAMVGLVVATATFHLVDATFVRLLVGAVAVLFALDFWLRPRRAQGPAREPSVLRGGFWGLVAGFTSFIAHAGGPPLSVYLLPLRMNKSVLVGTTIVFFIVVNYAKILPYAWLGQFQVGNLATSLVLAPLAPLGVRLGVWMHHRVSERLFYQVSYVLVFLVGAKLLTDVAREVF